MADSATLEQEKELQQFLKLVRPEWSKPRRHGKSDIQRVMEKLKSIGVSDKWELMQRVTKNRINEDLTTHGYPIFSKDTLDCVRKQTAFFRALETLHEPNYRQHGQFAHVPQMLSQSNLRKKPPPDVQQVCSDTSSSIMAKEMSYTFTEDLGSARMDERGWASGCSVGFKDFGGEASFFGDELSSFCSDAPRKLRGYRGEVKGVAAGKRSQGSSGSGSRSLAESVSLPNLVTPSVGRGQFLATPSRADGSKTCNSPSGAASLCDSNGASLLLAAAADARQSNADGRSRSRMGTLDFDRPATPKNVLVGNGTKRDLPSELNELRLVATGSLSSTMGAGGAGGAGSTGGAIEEAFDRLARAGEEDISNLDYSSNFREQGGTDAQVLHIAAFYGKMGIDTHYVAKLLTKPELTMAEVCQQLDDEAWDHIFQRAKAMATKPRPSQWAGFKGVPPHIAAVADLSHEKEARASSSPACGSTQRQRRRGGGDGNTKSVLSHAQGVLEEREALEEKEGLRRAMELEGPTSPTRKHVCSNIRARLKAERDLEAEKLEVQQSCNNIRRHLSLMGNAKRDLNTLRRTIEAEKHQPGPPALFNNSAGMAALQGIQGMLRSATVRDLSAISSP